MESLDAVCELLIHRKREDLAQLLSQATIDYKLNDIGFDGEYDTVAFVNAVIFASIPVYEKLQVLNSEASQFIHDAVREVCYAKHGRGQYIQDIDYSFVAESLTLDDALQIPADPIECVLQLKSIMIDRVTYDQGGAESSSLYADIRQMLMRNENVRDRLPRAVRMCRLLDDLWDFIQPDFPTYASRRVYFHDEFDPLMTFLEERASNPASDAMDASFQDFSIAGVRTIWQKAIERIDNDPEGAITAARSLVESVCKHVLEESGEQFNDWDNIYRQTSQLLNLAPDQQSEQSFRQLSGACNSIVGSLNEIRNRFGDAHGRGSSDAVPSARHAELAVNVAASLAIFIIRTRSEENTTGPLR